MSAERATPWHMGLDVPPQMQDGEYVEVLLPAPAGGILCIPKEMVDAGLDPDDLAAQLAAHMAEPIDPAGIDTSRLPPPYEPLVASAGWCAPPSPVYDFMPPITAERGGIRYATPDPAALTWKRPSRRARARARLRWEVAELRRRLADRIDPRRSDGDDW